MNQHAGDKFNWALLVADFFSRICFEPLVLTSSKSVVVFFLCTFDFRMFAIKFSFTISSRHTNVMKYLQYQLANFKARICIPFAHYKLSKQIRF
jgi:hypothetical protein